MTEHTENQKNLSLILSGKSLPHVTDNILGHLKYDDVLSMRSVIPSSFTSCSQRLIGKAWEEFAMTCLEAEKMPGAKMVDVQVPVGKVSQVSHGY